MKPSQSILCFTLISLVMATLITVSSAEVAALGKDKIAPVIDLPALSFEPKDVRLLEGPFRHAMDLDAKFLLTLEPDRLLSWFRKEAGLVPKAENYGGWEARGIAGHSLGHYLTACSRMYQTTDDARFRERVNYVVDDLSVCQKANTNGFLGAMPDGKKIFAEVARGEIRSAGFDLNGGWVPWYNLHKLFAGLIDAHRYTGNAKALEVASRLADWADATTRDLTDQQWQKMLACEHGGMNESMADLYALTDNTTYLALARKFYHKAILGPLAASRDELGGKHANTQIPKIIGAARIYELTGDQKFATISSFFWETVTHNHSYVTGGNSMGEHFGPPGKLNDRLRSDTTETCNTYNMLKLTRHLFERDPKAAYADYYERAVWNHILASQNPEDGKVCYFVSLRQGGTKQYQPFLGFTCCNGTGMENHASYGDNIYFHGKNDLWVNLFIASELNWADKGVRVRQETDFPNAGTTRLKFSCDKPVKLALHLRHPFWATNGFAVKLNGKETETTSRPQSFATLNREWRNGDVVELEMPLGLRIETMPDNPRRIALFDGPILLAGSLPVTSDQSPVPVFLTEGRALTDWVKPVATQSLRFRTQGVGRPADVDLKPFYMTHGDRYSVYWDNFSEEDWTKRQGEIRAEEQRLKELEARTMDVFQPGEMQPERDHNVKGEKSEPVEALGRKLRHAFDGGWFSFEMKVDPNATNQLLCNWWGSESGNRTFDILVDDKKITTQTLLNNRPGQFWDAIYPIPAELTKGKSKITIKLQAQPGNYAGGLFGCRMLRQN